MSRYSLVALSLWLGAAVPLSAQDRTVATRVYTEPTGQRFFVDGQSYKSAQVFLWPVGSKHVIGVETEQLIFPGTRTKFTGWTDTTNTLDSTAEYITVTADPAITFIKATMSTEYLVRVLFYQCSSLNTDSCRPPGTVTVGGMPSPVDVEQWFAKDSSVLLQAFPNPGFVFTGWGAAANYATSFTYTHPLKGPVTFGNIFAAGKRVTLLSNPPDLMVAPDRTPTKSPAQMDWALGSKHVLGAVTPQTEVFNGDKIWVFRDWSNGAKFNDLYTVSNTNIAETITANFVRGARASFVTEPSGLKLKIDGRDNWPAYNFVWGVGMKYAISAPAEQTDSRGRKYVFTGWSNGGPAAQEVTITERDVTNGFRLTAAYAAQNRITITTTPPGLRITANGKECVISCVVEGVEGGQVLLTAPAAIPLSDTGRFEFSGWSDGGEASHAYIFTARAESSVVANFKSSFRLTTVAEPGNGASFRVEPSSEDGFYPADVTVSVTAEAKPGYRFRRWDGDLSGTFKGGFVSMNVPRVVRAYLDVAPYTEDSGVRNAAGETPESLVAAGSIGSIFGMNLAAAYEGGPTNPLAQTIGGVTVRLQNRLLPLVFVSPQQINLQVPSDLADGLYTVNVKWENYPEVSAPMRVVRNAPGLFEKKVEDRQYGAALHEDGTEILPTSPALRGETVTLFGTGFGPYERRVVDGFPLPADPQYTLLDTVEVLAGDTLLETIWAGGAAGQTGTSLVRFRVSSDLNTVEGSAAIRIRINGRESNTVLLAVQ
ncbi:MAG TPA: hypothetical protein VM120_02340 [Bryobacteraceae bacterium]|nr:hypothetical protein [Bryobacteraceae bacterium]